MLEFTKGEGKLLNSLKTPARVQDYINSIPFNFEKDGIDVLKSPIRVLRENNAHCIEGAILAAYILSLHGYDPLLLHLEAKKNGKVKDYDHVVAPFCVEGLWGAISKTNHAVLRYREPVYRDIRELAMSYFHEYFTDDGKKTLRKYSATLNLNEFENTWPCEEGDLWGIDEELDKIEHFEIVSKSLIKKLRIADSIEREAGKITEYAL
jgi:hypothetical protein